MEYLTPTARLAIPIDHRRIATPRLTPITPLASMVQGKRSDLSPPAHSCWEGGVNGYGAGNVATHINRDTFDTDRNRSLPSGRRLEGV